MKTINIFDLMKNGVISNEENATVENNSTGNNTAENNLIENNSTENNSVKNNPIENNTENKNKKGTSKTKKETKKALSFEEKLELELKEYLEIEVKVFGSTIKTLTDKEEIESIKLNAIKENLIDMGYHELAGKVSWMSIPNSDKTKTILTIIPQFQNKG